VSETTVPPEPWCPHESCEICRTIPDRASSTFKGDETWGDLIPRAVERLLIVGAPYYDSDMSQANRALHKCPLCGTHYWWEFEYEYLAGGSENSTVYTRLDQETGARLERECLDHVAAARERSRVEAAKHVAALIASPDDNAIRAAASFAGQARRWGFDVDLSGAIPALIERLVRPPREGEKGALRWDLSELLSSWEDGSPERAREILRLIRSCNVSDPSAEGRSLVSRCETILAGVATS
jgi:hypothetical protein